MYKDLREYAESEGVMKNEMQMERERRMEAERMSEDMRDKASY